MLKRVVIGAAATIVAGAVALPAVAQKPGGILRIYHRDSPASMSVHEEGTIGVILPMMGVFNNLVVFDQHVPQNSEKSIVPDLATSWEWNEDYTALKFKLRDGVKWHDGKPFTAKDVKCTWDLVAGTSTDKLRVNPRKPWYRNLEGVVVNGDHEVTFKLKRPQPSFIAMIACRMGMTVARDARSVGVHTTSTVVQCIVWVIVLDAVFAVGLQRLGY